MSPQTCEKCGKPVAFVILVKQGVRGRFAEWCRCAEHTWVALTLLASEEIHEVREAPPQAAREVPTRGGQVGGV